LIEQATQEQGEQSLVSDNWLVNNWLGAKSNWRLKSIGSLVLVTALTWRNNSGGGARASNESPSQIAHRIMVESDLCRRYWPSSILPGVALALLAVDLAATTQLQSEMVYQIAVAYGLDLKSGSQG